MLSIGQLVRPELEFAANDSLSLRPFEVGHWPPTSEQRKFPIALDLPWEGDEEAKGHFIHSDSNMALKKSCFNGLFVGWRFHQLVEITLLRMVFLAD